jgi:hypothetical protein
MMTFRSVAFLLLLFLVSATKIFMFGGILVDDTNPAYHQIAL